MRGKWRRGLAACRVAGVAAVILGACTGAATPPPPAASGSATPAASLTSLLRDHYDAVNRNDVAAATAMFTNDAEVIMPWLIGPTCCKGIGQIRSGLQSTLAGYAASFKILELAEGPPGATARVEARTRLTADTRLERAILRVGAIFVADRIVRLEQTFDVSDPITERAVRYKAVLEADRASPTPSSGAPYVPAYRTAVTPPNGDVPNAEWIEADAPRGYKLLAAVRRPPGAGPFPVIVMLHPGGGFTRGIVTGYLGKGFVEAGFMVVVGCWFDGDNPLNAPDPRLIRCPAGPPYETSYSNRLPYAHALVQTARVLPGADPRRVGLYGESQGAAQVILLASTGTQVQAVVANSAGYSAGFSPQDASPIKLVKDLSAPVLILHGLVPDPAGRGLPEEAKEYEAALKQLGKTYEAVFYPGVAHEDLNTNPVSREDHRARAIAFFRKWLAPK